MSCSADPRDPVDAGGAELVAGVDVLELELAAIRDELELSVPRRRARKQKRAHELEPRAVTFPTLNSSADELELERELALTETRGRAHLAYDRRRH
jgi:hypothetical protein